MENSNILKITWWYIGKDLGTRLHTSMDSCWKITLWELTLTMTMSVAYLSSEFVWSTCFNCKSTKQLMPPSKSQQIFNFTLPCVEESTGSPQSSSSTSPLSTPFWTITSNHTNRWHYTLMVIWLTAYTFSARLPSSTSTISALSSTYLTKQDHR